MKNLTQWSSLYSIESKFNISVYASSLKKRLTKFSIYTVITFVIALATEHFFTTMSLLLPVVLVSFDWASTNNNHLLERFIFDFSLSTDGQVSLDNQQYNLLLSSRIGIFGVWLDLQCADMEKLTIKPLFIFKDSISRQDYSRLCRTVKSLTSAIEQRL